MAQKGANGDMKVKTAERELSSPEDKTVSMASPASDGGGDVEDIEYRTAEKQISRKVSIARVINGGLPSFSPYTQQKTPFNTFFKPVDVNNVYGMEERLEYTIAWSINPFVTNPYQRHVSAHTSGSVTPSNDPDSPGGGHEMMTVQQIQVVNERTMRRKGSVDVHIMSLAEQLGTPKASYAELFYDLFFVASLTSFGIKHEITQDQAIASYVAFFTVLWWVWTSQMLYDVRFETGDVIHRIFKFIQLLLLAGFAAFAGRFDVYYGFPDDYGLEDPGYYSERTSGFFAFRGMTIMYIISRIILLFQYLLLYYYARVKKYPARNQFIIQIASLVFSGGMWVGSYFLEADNSNTAMKIAKFGLWYGGIFVEMVSAILIWWTCRTTGFRRTHLTERFATLTLLILGEGVIGYAIALQAIVGGAGWGAPAGVAIVMVCLTIYLLWVYYFSTFFENAQYDVLHAYGWAYVHYPFHVALILVLQACNSLMLYANVSNAINAFGTGDSDVVGDTMTVLYSDNPDNSTMYSLVIGHTNITWDQAAVYNETFLDSFTPQQLAVLVFDVFGRIFLSYDLHPPDDYENLLHQLADGEVANDESTYESLLIMLVARFIISAVYYVVAAGSLLILSSLILLIQRWPKDRFAWVGIYTRLFFGAGFIASIAVWTDDVAGGNFLNSNMMMPTFVIILVIIVAVDFFFNMRALSKYRKAGKLM